MHGNKLVNPWSSLLSFPNVQVLYLDGNLLEELPSIAGSFRHLRVLGLSANHLKSLPEDISKLTNVEVLYLNHNQLSSLPAGMRHLRHLYWMNLTGSGDGLPSHLRITAFSSARTQILLHEIALEVWRSRARTAALAWVWVARQVLPMEGKHVWKLIAQNIYATRTEEVWDKQPEAESETQAMMQEVEKSLLVQKTSVK